MRYKIILPLTVLLFACRQATSELNNAAEDNGSIPAHSLDGTVMNIFVNTKLNTTSTLYRNDISRTDSATDIDLDARPASMLTLVTWKQRPNPRWYGANMPDSLLSVETLRIHLDTFYEYYAGRPLKLAVNPDSTERKIWIARQEPMILP
ncbi:MAG: hypothetical protein ABWZ25_12050 [Chitinophagaceae bacterium]